MECERGFRIRLQVLRRYRSGVSKREDLVYFPLGTAVLFPHSFRRISYFYPNIFLSFSEIEGKGRVGNFVGAGRLSMGIVLRALYMVTTHHVPRGVATKRVRGDRNWILNQVQNVWSVYCRNCFRPNKMRRKELYGLNKATG
jgi:hypothetical protein